MNPALKIIIFNVEHGFCSFIKCATGYSLLIDCGKKENFSPIKYIIDNETDGLVRHDGFLLTKFILSHPHDDHLQDIDNLKDLFPPAIMKRGVGYDWEKLKIGEKEKYENLDTYAVWQAGYNSPVTNEPNYGINIIDSFFLSPQEAFKLNSDNYVNNSSIPILITFQGTKYTEKILFGGDLMEEGWLELFKKELFKSVLSNIDFFVTSHHGHTTGYCKELFDIMGKNPLLNIVSAHSKDESVDSVYSSSAIGVDFGGEKRYMLSTRKDGSIIIEIDSEGRYSIRTENFNDNLRALRYGSY